MNTQKILSRLPSIFRKSHHTPIPTTTPNYLEIWQSLHRLPLTESTNPRTQSLINATRTNRPIPFYYHGGSTPGQLRLASIEAVFSTKFTIRTYVTAYCHLRNERRTFRTDRISLA